MAMLDPAIGSRSASVARAERAESEFARIFEEAGWRVQPPREVRGAPELDLLIRRGSSAYAVEIKAVAEGRSDRLIPLWSQAYLQALQAAKGKYEPLAVVAAPRIAPKAAEQIMKFIGDVAPDAAAGVFDFAGLRRFRGKYLEELDSEPELQPLHGHVRDAPADLFSDLNQWMLKVLLAPEIPQNLLSAPRERLRDASQLARIAKVSVMSASRFVRQMEQEGYLERSGPHFTLVRREELFRRWQASADRRVKEVPMRYVLRGDPKAALLKLLKKGRTVLALFAAAEQLKLGFVHGVPPYVYVPRLDANALGAWKNVVPAAPGEEPDVIVRQAPALQSVFRGAVLNGDVRVSDVLQVWLDVSSHPSRGQEQAELIRRRVLGKVIEADESRG
jgi:hypothetical protein